MVKCCAPECYNASYNKTPEITFHRFPKDENLKNTWVKNINRKNWQPNVTSVLCSKHFEANLLCPRDHRTVLIPGAIPTIFKAAELPQENKENVSGLNELQEKTVKTSTGGSVLHELQITIPAASVTQVVGPSPSTSGIPSTHTTMPSFSLTRLHDKENASAPEQSVTNKIKVLHDVQTSVPVASVTHIQPSSSTSEIRESRTTTMPSLSITRPHNKGNASAPPEQIVTNRKRTATGVLVLHDDRTSVTSASVTKTVESSPSTSGIPASHTKPCSSITTSHHSKDTVETSTVTKLQNRIISKNRKIKSLQERNRRMKKKVQQFSDIITELRKKLDEEQMSILSNIPVSNKDFMVRYLKKAQSSTIEKSYPPEVRSFALQLNFYSARAYNFVRDYFNTVLPHPVTLSRWYKKIDAQPGFTAESFKTLKSLSDSTEHKIFVNVSIDEMAIKKEQVWDRGQSKFKGHVDTGTEVSDDSLPLASQALVLMVTAINACWKIPIAFFFIASMTGEQRANIVGMAIEMLYEINIFVHGLTFDGAASNISMATVLGCNFSLNNFTPYFFYKDLKIYAFYDPCHMLKLIRNCFGDFKFLIDKNGNTINFAYLSYLETIAQEKGLHLGVKIRKAHIYFNKQKMKVRLAAQLFSKSVADALLFCKDILKLEQFKGCEATINFVNIINDCFDILNSRTTLAPGCKKALCAANIEKVQEFVTIASDYLLNLKFLDGKNVVHSARKTGFIGFVICLHNAIDLFKDLYNSGGIRYLCTYKISQDHLEMFFGKMRSRGGFNDNPNVVQFQTAYKKNVIITELKLLEKGILHESNILHVSSTKSIETINNNTPSNDKNDMLLTPINERNMFTFMQNILTSPLDEYTGHVITYIAGFISRRILEKIKCIICQQLVIGDKADFHLSLINIKDRGGLTYPSKSVIEIVKKCEIFFKIDQKRKSYSQFIYSFTNDLSNLDLLRCESLDMEHNPQHLYVLLKIIVKLYFDIRCNHLAKTDIISERNYLKKVILFKNK